MGGTPYTPTKEGCALSGLSRRTGMSRLPSGSRFRRGARLCARPRSGLRSLPWREAGAGRSWGVPPTPPPKRAAPSLDSPAGPVCPGCPPVLDSVGAHGCAPVPAPHPARFPGEKRAGRSRGIPQAATKEGCALSGLSRRTGMSRLPSSSRFRRGARLCARPRSPDGPPTVPRWV